MENLKEKSGKVISALKGRKNLGDPKMGDKLLGIVQKLTEKKAEEAGGPSSIKIKVKIKK